MIIGKYNYDRFLKMFLDHLCQVTDDHLDPNFTSWDSDEGCCKRLRGVKVLSHLHPFSKTEGAQFERFFEKFSIEVS